MEKLMPVYEIIFLIKYDSDGNKVWTELWGGSGVQQSFFGDLVISPDGKSIYVCASTLFSDFDGQTTSGNWDAFLTKYSSDGIKDWTRFLGTTSYEVGRDVAISSDGESIYITGFTEGDLDGKTNSGSGDTFLVKYDTQGNKVWTELLGSQQNENCTDVDTGSDNSIYITGFTTGDLDGQTKSGDTDTFLTKYIDGGPEVTKEWTQLLGNSNVVRPRYGGVATSSDESIYISGEFFGNDLDGQTRPGNPSLFLSKYLSDGTKEWTRLY